jgi:parallel beta-helix repeat protein
MPVKNMIPLILFPIVVALTGCTPTAEAPGQATDAAQQNPPPTVVFSPRDDIQTALQEALIVAQPGTTIQLEEGIYAFTAGLSLDVDGVTLRGRGMDRTVFDFAGQQTGSEGMMITSNGVVLEDFAVRDTKGDGIKSQGADNVVYRRLKVTWSRGPDTQNGAYGLYPVASTNVLVENCVAMHAADAGIYVGQSKNIIVRNNHLEQNVFAIEVENSHGADIYGNVATGNTGGIEVVDLPDLPAKGTSGIRVRDNEIYDNNHANFAPKGMLVANLTPGTGIVVLGGSNVEVFGNRVEGHDTYGMLIASYFLTREEIKDPAYYPWPEGIHVHHNTFIGNGRNPRVPAGSTAFAAIGTPVPAVLWDGARNPAKLQDGRLPAEARVYLHDNKGEGGAEATFADLGAGWTSGDQAGSAINRKLEDYRGEQPAVPAVNIPGVDS